MLLRSARRTPTDEVADTERHPEKAPRARVRTQGKRYEPVDRQLPWLFSAPALVRMFHQLLLQRPARPNFADFEPEQEHPYEKQFRLLAATPPIQE